MLYQTEKEMMESFIVCENFDFNITKKLAKEIGKKRIIFTGMGSSMIFPAKQARNRALKLNISNKIQAFFASDLFQYKNFKDTFVFLCSNSGRTKEIILLANHIKNRRGKCVAITAVKDSLLDKKCHRTIILIGGFEKGVAATKSVIEQGLIYDSLIYHLARQQRIKVDFKKLNKEVKQLGRKIIRNLHLEFDKRLIKKLAKFKNYYFVGLENGVAEEITLKAYEITRKKSFFYPDTHIVHGVAEAINKGAVIIFETSEFKKYISDFKRFSRKTNTLLLSIDDKKFLDGIKIHNVETFKNYCLLSAGWALLIAIAKKKKIDIDHPKKAVKVGNPY